MSGFKEIFRHVGAWILRIKKERDENYSQPKRVPPEQKSQCYLYTNIQHCETFMLLDQTPQVSG
jgi:hypothetical protein